MKMFPTFNHKQNIGTINTNALEQRTNAKNLHTYIHTAYIETISWEFEYESVPDNRLVLRP